VSTFTANFETPDLSAWLTGAGWGFHAVSNGQALRVYHSSDPLTLNTSDYLDVAAEAQFVVDYGTARLSMRQSAFGDYTALLDATGLVNLYRGGVLVATGQSTASTLDQWRTLRLSAVGDVLRVSVDGLFILSYTDPDPLPAGKVAVAAQFAPLPADYGTPYPPMNTLLVDNFSLLLPIGNVLPTPTSSATFSATPSLTVSATLTSTLAWLPDTTNWQIAFAETFDTGAAKPDTLGRVGQVVRQGTNRAVQPAVNQESTWVYLPPTPNTALQLQAWLGEGTLTLSLQGGFYRVEVTANGTVQFWQGDSVIQTLVLSNWNAAQWNAFRLSTSQGLVRFSMNGQEYLQVPDVAPSTGLVGFSGTAPALIDTIIVQSVGETVTTAPELAQPMALSAQLAPAELNPFSSSALAGYRLIAGTKLFYATRGYNFSNPPTNSSDSYRLIASDGVNETILVQAGDLLDDGRSLQTVGRPDWSWAQYELDANGDPVGNGLRVAFECIVEAQAQDVCFAQYNVYGQRMKLVNLSDTAERYETLTGWNNHILGWLEGEYDLSTDGVSIQRRDINDSGDANWIPAVTPILPTDTYLTSGQLGDDGFYLALHTPTVPAIYRYLFSTATLQFVTNADGGGQLLDVSGNNYLRKYAITGCNDTPPFYCTTTWYLTWQQGTETYEINSTISSSDHEQLWANFLPTGLVVPGYTPIGLGEFKTSLGLALNLQSPSELATTPLLVAGAASEVYQPWSLLDQQIKGVTFGSYTDSCTDCLLPVYEVELTPTPTPCPDCGAAGVFVLENAERVVFTQADGIYLGSASENRQLIARDTLLSEGSILQRIGEFEVAPNLQQIAFECTVDGIQQDLCLATLETGWQVSTLQRLTNTPENEFLGSWSPNSLTLVYLTSEFDSPHFGSTQVWLHSIVLGGSRQPLILTLPTTDYQVTDVLWATDSYFYYTVEGYLDSTTSPYVGGIYRQPTSGGTGILWSTTDLLPIPAAHSGGGVSLVLDEFDAQRGLLYEAFADFILGGENNIREQTYQLGVIPPNEMPWLLKDITGTAEFGGAALGDDPLDSYQGSFSRGDHFILAERTVTNTNLLQAVTHDLVKATQWLWVQLFGQGGTLSEPEIQPFFEEVTPTPTPDWWKPDGHWVQDNNGGGGSPKPVSTVQDLINEIADCSTNGGIYALVLDPTITYILTTEYNNTGSGLPPISAGCTIDIDGLGATIQRNQSATTPPFRIFTIENTAGSLTLRNIKLFGGNAKNAGSTSTGGAIHVVAGILNLDNVQVGYNTAEVGGGIFAGKNARVSIRNSIIHNNRAGTETVAGGGGGLAILESSGVRITESYIRNNVATGLGGGIWSNTLNDPQHEILITSSVLTRNSAPKGAAIGYGNLLTSGTIGGIITNSCIYKNGDITQLAVDSAENSASITISNTWWGTPNPVQGTDYTTGVAVTNPTSSPLAICPDYKVTIYDADRNWNTNPAEGNLERAAINPAIDKVAEALIKVSAYPTTYEDVFNRVLVGTEERSHLFFVRTNSSSVTVTSNGVSYTYSDVNVGVCKTYGAKDTPVYIAAAIICNGDLKDRWDAVATGTKDFTGMATEQTFVHELGHLFNFRSRDAVNVGLGLNASPTEKERPQIVDCANQAVLGHVTADIWTRGERGWGSGPALSQDKTPQNARANDLDTRPIPEGAGDVPLITTFQQNPRFVPGSSDILEIDEASADMFLNWVYRVISDPVYPPLDITVICNLQLPANHWQGTGFLNKTWSFQVASVDQGPEGTLGDDDMSQPNAATGTTAYPLFSGDSRYFKIHSIIMKIFAAQNSQTDTRW
jgi:hypothetical protein